ncbi:hypothetical protein PPERSA_00516 [Pseudocohnilembus persalinus]|uniref:UAA transporter n=1 Tax=Pseudocohnilembus persalinus TaxID=266149 RepID=A0A0V0QHY7_PSEPJ|nr:hypothetical protein PPERSA_00516 [Pseudocohnilembus persalinus]|eukprot:KRX01806.1 hypothetical protein PPERSA_00516 [Pseudocohnilembus persalinus]
MHRFLKFVIGCGGVYVSFMGYGVMQEKLYKSHYPTYNDEHNLEKFTFGFGIQIIQSFLAIIMGFILTRGEPEVPEKQQMGQIDQAKMGLFGCVSMLGSNYALSYVSYPVQALFKSCKVLSVLLVGLLFGKTKYRFLQYLTGILVTLGVFGFNFMNSKSGGNTQILGLVLLMISLLSDGLMAEEQNSARSKFNLSSFRMMLYSNKYTFLISLAYSILTQQLPLLLDFLYLRPSALPDLFLAGLLGAIGLPFIFYTIKHFGPANLAIITTTRKLFTVFWV